MTNITVAELRTRMNAGETVNLVDVREPDERQVFNIGGHFIPLGDLMSMQTEKIDELKEQELICYCRSGKRSMQAGMMLESLGFTNVKNLTGGMIEWQETSLD